MSQQTLRHVSSQQSCLSVLSTATTLYPEERPTSAIQVRSSLTNHTYDCGRKDIKVTPLAVMRAWLSQPKEILSDAVRCNDLTKLEWLLSNNARTKLLDSKSLGIALMRTAGNGFLRVAEVLIEYGVDVDVADEGGQRPLHLAATLGYDDMCMLLVEAGADVDARDDFGSTPLAFAAAFGTAASVKRLLDLDASMEALDNLGRTPLERAARFKQRENMKLLIEEGAQAATYSQYMSVDEEIEAIIDKFASRKFMLEDRLPLSFVSYNGHARRILRELQDFD